MFLTRQFLDTLDDSQLSLMNMAMLPYEDYSDVLDLLKPVEALVEMIRFNASVILSISSEEETMEEIVSELISHELESREV